MTAAELFTKLAAESKDGTVLIPIRKGSWQIGARAALAWGAVVPFDLELIGISGPQEWRIQARRMNELLPGIVSGEHLGPSPQWDVGVCRRLMNSEE